MHNEYTSFREEICKHVNEKYNSKIEFLWRRFPSYCVFRNNENKKWYGIIMNIPYQKLGINKDGFVDILNVKVGDSMLKDFLIHQEGFSNAYHMARGNWISVFLDGTVDLEKIFDLIDESYNEINK